MRILLTALFAFSLSACATTQAPPVNDPIVTSPAEPEPPIIIAQPDLVPPPAPYEPPAPPPAPEEPPIIEIYEQVSLFDDLPHWEGADHTPALMAFKKSCQSFAKADTEKALNKNLPEYGHYADWMPACQLAVQTPDTAFHARAFFESEFQPVNLSLKAEDEGLLTGYYEPEVTVRRVPDEKYSEPILATPSNKAVLSWPRSKITAKSSRVIAYGEPIEVFFMQVQGSGRLRFPDGRIVRAAYDGNNGHKYTSIGRVLVNWGAMTKDQASKQAIENWMHRAGPKKTRELINRNKRYIFFAEQAISGDEGPKGGMQVPLTEMGSIAIDKRYHPYGTLAWLNTKIPAKPGDYQGYETGVLVSAQDTGTAIKGPLRGDLFFGPGDYAGKLAGVMKHPVRWTILLPVALAMRHAAVS